MGPLKKYHCWCHYSVEAFHGCRTKEIHLMLCDDDDTVIKLFLLVSNCVCYYRPADPCSFTGCGILTAEPHRATECCHDHTMRLKSHPRWPALFNRWCVVKTLRGQWNKLSPYARAASKPPRVVITCCEPLPLVKCAFRVWCVKWNASYKCCVDTGSSESEVMHVNNINKADQWTLYWNYTNTNCIKM